jgi:ATP synthase F1 gamma subunit
MKTLVSLKKDLEFNRGLSTLIEILKNIAATQYRTMERKIRTYKKLLSILESFFLDMDLSSVSHPFLSPVNKPLTVVAVTSDTGLLGGLNVQVVNQALLEMEEAPGKVIVIGERGKLYLHEIKVPFVAFPGIIDDERYAQAMQLRNYLADKVFDGSIGRLKVVYPRPLSFTVQRVETVTFLPFATTDSVNAPKEPGFIPEMILESRIEDIIEYLVYIWMGQKLYEIFGLSRLAEFSARFVHLEQSNQRLKEQDKKISLEYFRVRHELIDRNMRELFAARLLYAS